MCAERKVGRRKPFHPGVILNEHYIKPLGLNPQELASRLGITFETLKNIQDGKDEVTPSLAFSLAKTFDTTQELWLNLQQKYAAWKKEN